MGWEGGDTVQFRIRNEDYTRDEICKLKSIITKIADECTESAYCDTSIDDLLDDNGECIDVYINARGHKLYVAPYLCDIAELLKITFFGEIAYEDELNFTKVRN